MAERTVNAIVLRRRDSGESDRRLTLLTEEVGKIDVVAKGARKAASRLAGISDPLSVATMCLAEGRHTRFITQAQPQSSFRGLRTDYERLSMGLAICELYAATLPIEQPFPEAFELLRQSLRALESHPKPVVATVWAQCRLLALSGFLPQFGRCVVTDSPVAEAWAFVSPHGGGYLCDAEAFRFTDRFRVRAEVLYALQRLPDLEEPPANLKFASDCLIALLPFWRAIADVSLPANQAMVGEVAAEDAVAKDVS